MIQEIIKLLLVIYIVLLTSSSVLYNYCCFWSIRWFHYLSIHQVQLVYKGIYFEGSKFIVLTKKTAMIVLLYVSYINANLFSCNIWIIFFPLHTSFIPESLGKWYWPGWACAGQYHFLTFLNNWFQPIRVNHMIMCYRPLHQYCAIALSSMLCYIPLHPYCYCPFI